MQDDGKPQEQPPIDNEHVAEGATQFTAEEIAANKSYEAAHTNVVDLHPMETIQEQNDNAQAEPTEGDVDETIDLAAANEAPQPAQKPHNGLLPWDKVFLELDQHGIDVKIETDAKARTVGISASFGPPEGPTKHIGRVFTYASHLTEFEEFSNEALAAISA